MKKIVTDRFKMYPQDGMAFCILASILAILKYHIPKLERFDNNGFLIQFTLMTKMIAYANDNFPSFNAAVGAIGPFLETKFSFINTSTGEFDKWISIIKKEINNYNPVAIATRNAYGIHTRVVLGYDDENKEFLLSNPGFLVRISHMLNKSGASLRIDSAQEIYRYDMAENDFNLPDGTRDILIIHLK